MNEELEAEKPPCSRCGYPEDSFPCRIRHIHMNTGDAKSARDVGKHNHG